MSISATEKVGGVSDAKASVIEIRRRGRWRQVTSKRSPYSAPIRFFLYWTLGTFGAFALFGNWGAVTNKLELTAFIGAVALAFMFGFSTSLNSRIKRLADSPAGRRGVQLPHVNANTWVAVCAVYFILYGYASLQAYGGNSLGAIFNGVLHPGSAYAAKLQQAQELQGAAPSSMLQFLTLGAFLQLPLIPMMVLYWRQIRPAFRILGCFALVVWLLYFLYIGTLQGIGQVLLGALAGGMVLAARRRISGERKANKSRRLKLLGLVGGVLFIVYMATAQSSRLTQFNVTKDYAPNPLLSAVAGESFARGIAVVAHYPTHGYEGLSYNLETPFQSTHGLGFSRALDSYWAQYMLGSTSITVEPRTYPGRTETRMGWPALQKWATVYPWIASDVTFPGVILLMFFIGRGVARVWWESVTEGRVLSLLLFSEAIVFIAFIPANDQVLISRPSFVAFVTTLMAYLLLPRRAS